MVVADEADAKERHQEEEKGTKGKDGRVWVSGMLPSAMSGAAGSPSLLLRQCAHKAVCVQSGGCNDPHGLAPVKLKTGGLGTRSMHPRTAGNTEAVAQLRAPPALSIAA